MEEKLLFKAIVGSQSSGCATPESDIDIKGVYIQSIDDLITFGYKPQIEVSKDETYWEVQRFLELLLSANPSVLELLNSPEDCILKTSPQFDLIVKNKDKFLTKKCLKSFGGYVKSQLLKASGTDKKMNYEKERIERKSPLDFCYVAIGNGRTVTVLEWLEVNGFSQDKCGLVALDHIKDCYDLFYDVNDIGPQFFKGLLSKENSNQLKLSQIPKEACSLITMFFNQDHYSKHCKEFKEYSEWLLKRNTSRYVDVEGHGQQIDGKNMLHCRRLLDMAGEIATVKELNVRRPNVDYLLSIRKGKVSLKDIIKQAEIDLLELDTLYADSDLPESVSLDFVNELLLKIRKM